MIYIRTDANEEIATGHIMRCMTIATELIRLGQNVEFIVRDKPSIDMIEGNFSYNMISMPQNEDEFAEIEIIREMVSGVDNPIIFLDLYRFDAKHMQAIKKFAKVVTFDDLYEEKYPADIIINYNLYYRFFDYKRRYENTKTTLLLGEDYVPLRSDFEGAFGAKKRVVEDVMVICGGGDKYRALYPLVEKICERGLNLSINFHIVVGRLNPDKNKFDLVRGQDRIYIYENVEQMSSFMEKMDVVISAASTVLYESCKMAIPTIFFCMEENQKYDTECFSEDDIMLYAGDVRSDKNAVLDKILDLLIYLQGNYDIRKSMQDKMKNLIDGYGAARIAKAIIKLVGEEDE